MRLLFSAEHPDLPTELDEDGLSGLYRHPVPRDRAVWLRSNFVTSLDGSIQGADGRSGSINTPSDQHVFALHRAHADAILVGAETVRKEGYRAVDLAPWQRDLRAREGLTPYPILVIITRSLGLSPEIAASGGQEVGSVLVLTTGERKEEEELKPLTDAGIEVVQLPGADGVDLGAAAAHLGDIGRPRVLCEGGSRLHRDLLAADLLDEMSLTLAPVMVGGDGRRTTVGDPLTDSPGFDLGSALYADDGTLLLRYVRHGRRHG